MPTLLTDINVTRQLSAVTGPGDQPPIVVIGRLPISEIICGVLIPAGVEKALHLGCLLGARNPQARILSRGNGILSHRIGRGNGILSGVAMGSCTCMARVLPAECSPHHRHHLAIRRAGAHHIA
jgi:hypothetical protein